MPVKGAVRRLELLDEMVCAGIADGLALRTPDDVPFDGRALSLDGRPVLNFGSCGYLGLEFDPRLQAGVSEAVRRYGTQFASSRIYMQAPPYAELEHHLGEMFGGHVLVAPTTTLGHVAALPVLVGPQDAVIMDQQVHQSVQMAADHLRCQGTVIKMIRHNDINQLEAVLAQHATTPGSGTSPTVSTACMQTSLLSNNSLRYYNARNGCTCTSMTRTGLGGQDGTAAGPRWTGSDHTSGW